MLSHAEQTRYPRLYKQTEWGRQQSMNASAIVIANRNRLVEDYHLKQYVPFIRIPQYVLHHMPLQHCMYSHVECYQTWEGQYIIVVQFNNWIVPISLIHRGWILIDPLYSPEQTTTYMKWVCKRHTTHPVICQGYDAQLRYLFGSKACDYRVFLRNRMMASGLAQELMANRFHPQHMDKWAIWGHEDEQDFV